MRAFKRDLDGWSFYTVYTTDESCAWVWQHGTQLSTVCFESLLGCIRDARRNGGFQGAGTSHANHSANTGSVAVLPFEEYMSEQMRGVKGG